MTDRYERIRAAQQQEPPHDRRRNDMNNEQSTSPKAVAWARPVYARPVGTPDTGEWDELVDIEFHNRPEKPEGEGWRPLVVADTCDGTAPLPRINVKCETVDNGITGSTYLEVIRVEQEDDGSLTAVIDQKPVTVERAREALEELRRKQRAVKHWNKLADDVERRADLRLLDTNVAKERADCYRRTARAIQHDIDTLVVLAKGATP